jgi:hypothetical protein
MSTLWRPLILYGTPEVMRLSMERGVCFSCLVTWKIGVVLRELICAQVTVCGASRVTSAATQQPTNNIPRVDRSSTHPLWPSPTFVETDWLSSCFCGTPSTENYPRIPSIPSTQPRQQHRRDEQQGGHSAAPAHGRGKLHSTQHSPPRRSVFSFSLARQTPNATPNATQVAQLMRQAGVHPRLRLAISLSQGVRFF